MSIFNLKSEYSLKGDQPRAVKKLTNNLKKKLKDQVLLGVTGSGKTLTMAHVIKNSQRPTLIISHNKTLAGQLFQEFRTFFPSNAVHYFVSYYDYYQPEAYLPPTDTYIQKDAKINQEIDKLRHAATQSVMLRQDALIIASVSCIYGLGSPANYNKISLKLKKGSQISQREVIKSLIDLQYERTNLNIERGKFQKRGEAISIYPVSTNEIFKIEWDSDKINHLSKQPHDFYGERFSDYLKGVNKNKSLNNLEIFPAKHFVTPLPKLNIAINNIKAELAERLKYLRAKNKLLEVQRLEERTNYDLEMLQETGYCHGVENYSRHLDFRKKGVAPATLIDYFNYAYKNDWLLFIDESHMTIPQLAGMYAGDRARKKILIQHGFRLPSALDNRPLNFKEFEQKIHQAIYVSATPGSYEIEKATHGSYQKITYSKKKKDNYLNIEGIAEQLIRPTGLLDPAIEIKPIHSQKGKNQIQDLIEELQKEIKKGGRALVVTLTKRLAEEISNYLEEKDFKVCYLHSEVKTFDRIKLLKQLRQGSLDVIVGINLLREGLDLPEVSLVAILDADKEGFLRNQTSLIQTMGRAARHPQGRVILYADDKTDSIKRAVEETERRRKIQITYNKKNKITPKQIKKAIREDIIPGSSQSKNKPKPPKDVVKKGEKAVIEYLKGEMRKAAENLDFKKAAQLRDEYKKLEKN
jgi:excinuclease ABC subunit B